MQDKAFTTLQILAAWAVHLFTASGLLAAFMALVAIDNGAWAESWYWLLLCLFIDGVDGTFARMANVKEVLPQMEGKYIDYVIDFATYAIIPVFFFYKVELTSSVLMPWSISIMLLTSAIYYGKSDMTGGSDKGKYFIGFPVLWNVVVFLLFFILHLDATWNFILVVGFGMLHFVPLKFAYPSRARRFFWPHIIASCLVLVAGFIVLYYYPDTPDWARYSTLGIVIWFMSMAVVETVTEE